MSDDECGFDVLGAEGIGDMDQARATVDSIIAQKRADRDQAKASTDYIIAQRRERESLPPLVSSPPPLVPSPSYSSRAPLYTASAYTAARGCHANGMTIWHYLFFAVLLMAIFFAPRVFAFVKKHAAPLLRDGLRAVSTFGRRLRRSTT